MPTARQRSVRFAVATVVASLASLTGGAVAAGYLFDRTEPIEGEPPSAQYETTPVEFASGTSPSGIEWRATWARTAGGDLCIDVAAVTGSLAGNSAGGCFDPSSGEAQVTRVFTGEDGAAFGLVPVSADGLRSDTVSVEFPDASVEARVDARGLWIATGRGMPLSYRYRADGRTVARSFGPPMPEPTIGGE